jgi:hypothetical protein
LTRINVIAGKVRTIIAAVINVVRDGSERPRADQDRARNHNASISLDRCRHECR